jgi:hypothetical protein
MGLSLFSKDIIFDIFALNGSMGKTFFTGPWLLALKQGLNSNNESFFLCKNKIISLSKKINNHRQNNSRKETEPESQKQGASSRR